jgi:hypothetical protein
MANTHTFVGNGSISTPSISTPSNWSPAGGAGPGDTAIIASGTATGFDISFSNNTVEIGAAAGTAALVNVGDTAASAANPTVDAATLIESAVSGDVAPESSEIAAEGIFINAGRIAANGPAGSGFAISITSTTINSTLQPAPRRAVSDRCSAMS